MEIMSRSLNVRVWNLKERCRLEIQIWKLQYTDSRATNVYEITKYRQGEKRSRTESRRSRNVKTLRRYKRTSKGD